MTRFTICAAMALGLAQPLAAQEAAEAPAGPNWLVSCSNQETPAQLTCTMSQNVVVAASNARLLTAIFQPTDDQSHTLSLVLPFGLDLTADVVVNVDNADWLTTPVSTCDADACYASLTISNEELEPLRSASTLNVVLQNMQAQSINMALNLNGFGPSLDMMAR